MTTSPQFRFALPPVRFAASQRSFRKEVLTALSSDPGRADAARAQRLKGLALLAAIVSLNGLLVSGRLKGGWLLVCVALSQPMYLIAAMGIAHDASHNAFSKRPWLNRLGTHVFDVLGVNSYIWHFDHVIAHHRAPNVSHYDANLTGWGLRLDPRRPLRWYHAYQHIYAPLIYSLASLFKVFVGDFLAFTRTQVGAYLPDKHSRMEVLRLLVWKTVALGITLFLPLFRNADLSTVLLGYVLGHLAAGLLMGAIFQPTHTNEFVRWPLTDARGQLAHSFEAHTLSTTADFCVGSPWITWISGGLNIHAVHHMFPKISHLELPRVAQLVARIAPRHGLHYVRFESWRSAIRSHLRALARLGRVAPEDVPDDGDLFDARRRAHNLELPSRLRSPECPGLHAAEEP